MELKKFHSTQVVGQRGEKENCPSGGCHIIESSIVFVVQLIRLHILQIQILTTFFFTSMNVTRKQPQYFILLF